MPIYAYRCDACGFRKDVLQKLSDPALVTCPSCGAASFAKQLSAPAFQLKGTGWYATDFRDKGKKADAEAAENGSKGAGDGEAANGAGDKTADAKTEGGAAKRTDGKPDSAPAANGSGAAPAPAAAAPAPAAKPAGGASTASGGGSGAN
jgi:putative FmdB family regulatory protein